MEAIQAMGISGGWPLNVFLTPDQRPFYGGTYFPPDRWNKLLVSVAHAYKTNRSVLENSAEKFKEALNIGVVAKYGLHDAGKEENILDETIAKLKTTFDPVYGGIQKAPKFPMPVIWNFVLHYYAGNRDQTLIEHLCLTLDKMFQGGLYDQVGGGFARYSVDEKWFAPHFEKMLYDNAQLISLYAQAFSISQKQSYRTVVYQTIDFLSRELLHQQGGFYSALDADSEGEEGKFYLWQYDDFLEVVGKSGEFLVDFYGLTPEGNWENGQNILYQKQDIESFAEQNNMDINWLGNMLAEYNEKLLTVRGERIRPGLDNKIICGWNGLMIKGLTDAYAVFSEQRFLKLALTCAHFIEGHMTDGDQLYRTHTVNNDKIPAFLEDYAAIIAGYLNLYQVTFQEKWLYRAQNLMSYSITHFYDQENHLFYYTADNADDLIARKQELFDNVIPSSNSMMVHNLWLLGVMLDRHSYLDQSQQMLSRIKKMISREPAYLSHWATALSYFQFTTAEVVIAGKKAEEYRQPIASFFHPHKVMMGSKQPTDLPLLKDRVKEDQTQIHVCYNQACQLPTTDPDIAISQLSY
jgi:uncharacterized protein YyaL (SSP411 family)